MAASCIQDIYIYIYDITSSLCCMLLEEMVAYVMCNHFIYVYLIYSIVYIYIISYM